MSQLEQLKKAIDAKKANNVDRQPRYGLRKLSVGLVSCLIGTLILTPTMGGELSQSFAATTAKQTVSEQRIQSGADNNAVENVETKEEISANNDKNTTILDKARKAMGLKANVRKSPQAHDSGSNLPSNIVDKNNWDEDLSISDSYFPFNQEVGITPKQRPVRVTTSDPINMWDVNYMGWFVDADGRTNLRLTYNENSVVVSAVWHTALFKFDSDLYNAVDWGKSYATITDNGETKVKFTDSNQANAKRLDVREAIKSRTNRKNNMPINLVLKEGTTLNNLPKRNLLIQMRLLDKNFERLYAFAPKGTSIDYSTHTKSTIIPLKSDIDSYFMRGNMPNGNLFVEQRTFMSEFIANPGRYTDSSDIGVIRTEYQRAHENKAKANTYDGKPVGFVQMFDAELVQFLKEDSQGNIAFTSLLNRDRTERKGNASYPYNQYGIKKNQINYTPDGKIAYIILAENNFEVDGVNVVRVEKMDGSVYEGTGGFTCIDYNVDKTKLREAFETPGAETNQVRFGAMSGWIDSNPKGWETFKMDFDKELKIQEGESFIIDTGAKPKGGSIAFQVGTENSLIRKMVGNYMAARSIGAKDGIDKIEELGNGLYKIHLREGATIKKGDAVRLFMPDTENHDKEVFFMGISNPTKINEGGATLSVNKDRNIDLHLAYKADKCEFIYTPAGSTDTKTVTFTKGLTWENDAPRGLIKGLPNTAILATGGNYVIDSKKLEPGKPVIAKAYAGDKVYESEISYVPLNKGDKYKKMVIADNTDSLSSIVVAKSMYVPYQDIFTNDYVDGRSEIYEDSRLLPGSEEKFMTDTTKLEGYSKYDSGVIRARYITEKGNTLVGKATAEGDEYNDDGDVVKSAEKEIDIDGKKYSAYEYNLSLADFSEFRSGAGETIKLKKDMRFIFNASDGSALPSNWISQRVKTRVLFNATLGTLEGGKDKSVKIVPDNVKYYGETGYAPNGFVGESANVNTGDNFEKDPIAPAGKAFLGWVTESGLNKLKAMPTRSIPAGHEEADFITTSEKFNKLEKDTDVFTDKTPVSTHRVVYAVYTAEKLITFDANGGKFEGDKTQVTDDISDGVNEPKAPTKEGKEFKGWATKADATEPDVTDLSKVPAGTTVYAVWADATPAEKSSDKYEPEYSKMTVKQGETATADPKFKDKDGKDVNTSEVPVAKYELGKNAPAGASIDAKTGKVTYEAPADQAEGDVDIPVVVTYKDGSTDNAVAKATVSAATPAEKNSDKYEPEYSKMTVKQGETATADPKFKDNDGKAVNTSEVPVAKYELGKNAPAGASIDAKTGKVTYVAPADQAEGDVDIPVVVTYKDGSTDNAVAKATVSAATPAEKNSDKYEPEYSKMTVKQGETATADPKFKDNDGKAVNTSEVPVAKYELEKNAPAGASIDAKTGKVTYVAPADQAEGDVDIPVVVTYKDGSTDNAVAKATVSAATPAEKNSDKYEPEYSKMTVKQGETATADPKFKDKDGKDVNTSEVPVAKYELGKNAPAGASIDAKTGKVTYEAPADQAEGDVDIPVVVTYKDGSTDNAVAKATVSAATPAEKNSDKYEPEYSKMTVKQGETATADPKFKDNDGKAVNTSEVPVAKYELGKNAPAGASIDAKTGKVTYVAPADQAEGDVDIPVVVTYKDGSTDNAVAKATVSAATPDTTAPSAPKVDAKDDGSIEVMPPKDADTKTVEITYTPEGSDKPVTVVATKGDDGTWSVPDGSDVKVDPNTGKVTIPEDKVKDGTEVEAIAKDEAGNKSDKAKATSKDVNAPSAPKVDAKDDGSIEVMPPKDADTKTVEITYTPEGSDKPVTVVATKGDDGTWSVPDGSDVKVDPATGKVTIPEDKVKDGTEVEAIAKDEAGNKSDKAKATSKDVNAPSAPKVDAKDDGSIEVMPPKDADTKTVEITYTPEGSDKPVTVVATKGDDGTWSVPDGSDVKVDPATGKVTIPEDKVKDGTEVEAIAKDEAGNKSDKAKAESQSKLEVEIKPATATEGEKVKDDTKVVIPNKDNATITASEEVNGLRVDENGNLIGTPMISDWGKTEETRVIQIPVTVKTDLETIETFVSITINRDTDGDGIPDIIDEDDDNDGISDVQEAKDGTDPKDANSKVVKRNNNDKKSPKTSDANDNGIATASTTLLGSLLALVALKKKRKEETR